MGENKVLMVRVRCRCGEVTESVAQVIVVMCNVKKGY